MNRGSSSETSDKRKYTSTLREAQAEQTRDKILAAIAEQAADGALTEFSIPRIAKRAGVSEPTVYRYFPNRQALWDAFASWWNERAGTPKMPETLDELANSAARLFPFFDERKTLYRANNAAGELGRLSRPGQSQRDKHFINQIARAADHLDEREAFAIGAVFRYLNSSLAWQTLADRFGLDGVESGKAVAWVSELIIAQLRRDDARAQRTKRSTK